MTDDKILEVARQVFSEVLPQHHDNLIAFGIAISNATAREIMELANSFESLKDSK